MDQNTLQAAVDEAQNSLAVALSRIEGLRIRDKHLSQENARLRSRLRDAGIADLESDSPGSHRSADSPRAASNAGDLRNDSGVKREGATQPQTGLGTTGNSGTEVHTIVLYGNNGKVPASIVATPGSLEVYERKAKIYPADFVGMSSVQSAKEVSGKSSSWMSTLFGKPKSTLLSPKKKEEKRMAKYLATLHEDAPQEVPLGPVRTDAQERSAVAFNSGNAGDGSADRNSWGASGQAGISSSGDNKPQEEESFGSSLLQILWKDGGGNGKLRKMVFEAGVATKAFVGKHIDSWSNTLAGSAPVTDEQQASRAGPSQSTSPPQSASNSATKSKPDQLEDPPSPTTSPPGTLVPPRHFIPAGLVPKLSERSELLSEDHLKCLTAAVPKRFKQAPWTLLYSTARHGFSLQTLYRRSAGMEPTILALKDSSDFVFGAYCSEAWKMSPRFFGTGETFVFQLEPHRVYYPWKRESKVPNDFFLYGSMESIGVGGTGHFSLWFDGELLYGHSGMCDTFGSPCLAENEEFKIITLELWTLGS